MTTDRVIEILKQFNIHSIDVSFATISHGYINDTYRISLGSRPRYILQRLNTEIFSSPEDVQFNIDLAIKKLHSESYNAVEFLRTNDGSTLFHLNDDVFRLMNYVADSRVYSISANETIAFEAGRIIGIFHKLLDTEDIHDYKIPLADFHDLTSRVAQFEAALNTNENTNPNAQALIEIATGLIPEFESFQNVDLPERICHNDTKLNNILFDRDHKALCLIDLDTIMPGYFPYDFGDAVRTIVNPASEDEKDLSKIKFDLNMFEAFIGGLKSSGLKLFKEEIDFLPLSAALMPFLHGLR
ncbi:MAG: aminoglycoside phosphotransferase family protein, partial [Bacteroidia bacterium]|nr:aminoglycoside phosphotransferase family protein [Bacteroidia bacterium]